MIYNFVNRLLPVTIRKGDNVYIAGPMTGRPDFNAEAFKRVETYVVGRYGCNVVNPINLPHVMGFNRSHTDYLIVCMGLVRTSDAIILLPDWEDSVGARVEVVCAINNKKRVYEYVEHRTVQGN